MTIIPGRPRGVSGHPLTIGPLIWRFWEVTDA